VVALGWRKRQILRKNDDKTPALQSIRLSLRSTDNESISDKTLCDKSCSRVDVSRCEGYNSEYPCITQLERARRTTEERSS